MSKPDMLHLGVLISGRGSNLQALIDACAAPGFPARIALVISNVPDAYGLERARAAGIATKIIAHKDFAKREDFDASMTLALQHANVGLVCLAGFMRILSGAFVQAWHGKLINIHPSLLPSFKGLHTHERALEAGCKLHGCTVHFVEPELDEGPILLQAAVDVHDDDTPDSLSARVLEKEHKLYPQAVRLIAEGRTAIQGMRVRIQDPLSPAGRG
jgi:phosphoribosylglycinamide formyltransferase 1